MEIAVAIFLVAIGLVVGLLGYKLFRAIMPIAGLVVGATIGFTGFQGIFGTGPVSMSVALLAAVVFGVVLALLSYAFFDLALIIFMGVAMSSLFTLLGIALGLSSTGFILGLLSLAGFIIGILFASSSAFLAENLVSLVTAYVGSGLVLAGIFLLFSGVSLQDMYTNGVLHTAAAYASKSFIWILVWIAGIVVMRQAQLHALMLEMFPEHLQYKSQR